YLLTLPPYGFYWFVLANESEAPSWHTQAPEPMPEYITMVFRHALTEALASSTGSELERDALPAYLAKRRWFSAKDQIIKSACIKSLAPLPGAGREVLLAQVEATTDGGTSCLLLLLSVSWVDEPTA